MKKKAKEVVETFVMALSLGSGLTVGIVIVNQILKLF